MLIKWLLSKSMFKHDCCLFFMRSGSLEDRVKWHVFVTFFIQLRIFETIENLCKLSCPLLCSRAIYSSKNLLNVRRPCVCPCGRKFSWHLHTACERTNLPPHAVMWQTCSFSPAGTDGRPESTAWYWDEQGNVGEGSSGQAKAKTCRPLPKKRLACSKATATSSRGTNGLHSK